MNNRNVDFLLRNIKSVKIKNTIEDSIDDWDMKISKDNLLCMLHLNIQSLRSNWEWLLVKLSNVLPKLDILILSEININNEEAECYNINHFSRLASCRHGQRGGGILIFYGHDTLSHTDTLTYRFNKSETLPIRITHMKTKMKFTLLAIYRPPKSN